MQDLHVLVIDERRRSDAQIRQRLFDLRWKGQLRVQPRSVALASAKFVLGDDGEWRCDPSRAAIVGPNAHAPVRVLRA